MTVLDGIRATREQDLQTTDENGVLIRINLQYLASAESWVMNLSSGNFTVNGMRVCNSPNLLQQYHRIIPFGLAVIVSDGGEPFRINDFSENRAQLAVLTQAEVQQITALYTELRG